MLGFLEDVRAGLGAKRQGAPTMKVPIALAMPPAVRPSAMPELAPGVLGIRIEHAGAIWFPYVMSTRPGAGDMGRFLDALGRTLGSWRFPGVISGRLVSAVERRGWSCRWASVFDQGTEVDVIDVWCLDVFAPSLRR